MIKKFLAILMFLFLGLFAQASAKPALLDGHVLDNARVLSIFEQKDINTFLVDLNFEANKNIMVVTVKSLVRERISDAIKEYTVYYFPYQMEKYKNGQIILYVIKTGEFAVYDCETDEVINSDDPSIPPRMRHELKYYFKKKDYGKGVLVATYFYALKAADGIKFYAPFNVAVHRFPPFGYIVFILIALYAWFWCFDPKNRSGATADSIGFMQPHVFKGIKKYVDYHAELVQRRKRGRFHDSNKGKQ